LQLSPQPLRLPLVGKADFRAENALPPQRFFAVCSLFMHIKLIGWNAPRDFVG
jgi:hypothetical protein